jgi:hypothetical protein
MSDDIKKLEDETLKAQPSVQLSEPELDEIVGGTEPAPVTHTGLATGKRQHMPY